MPYNRQNKLLFVHIPKTGGTSIEYYFEMDQPDNFCFYRWDRDQVDFIEKHKHLTNSDKITYEPQHYPQNVLRDLIDNYQEYFKFTFVRNPYTKMLSEYYWLLNLKNQAPKNFDPRGFHEWCMDFLSNINSSHKEPQVSFIDDSINFIGKFESMEHDFNLLIEQLISRKNQLYLYQKKALPILNTVGQKKDLLLPYVFDKTRNLIFQTYREDFKQFNYDY